MMGRSKPSLPEVSSLVVYGQESLKHLIKTIFSLIYSRKKITPKIVVGSYMVSHQIGRTIELEINPSNFQILAEISNQLGSSSK